MIIYGHRASHVKSTQLPDIACAHCGEKGQIVASVYSRYAHIFWIPMFPFSKKVIAQCQHCKAVWELNEMPSDLKEDAIRFRSTQKTPIWQFIGLGIIGAIILFGIISSVQKENLGDKYLESPAVNDVYKTKVEEGYSTMKVMEVAGDTVYVVDNEYAVNKYSGISSIDKDENYLSDDWIPYTKEELKNMKKEGTIRDIDRH